MKMSKFRIYTIVIRGYGKPPCNKKANLLVYEKTKEKEYPPRIKTIIPPISCPHVTKIKICTGAQLKKMCPPLPCPCPPKRRSKGFLKRLASLIAFAAKSALAGGVIFITYDMGIWGDSECTGKIFNSLCQAIMPKFMDVPIKEKYIPPACQAELELFTMFQKDPYCCEKFPIDIETQSYAMEQMWNKMVSATFSALVRIPERIKGIPRQLYCKIVDSEECHEEKAEPKDEPCCPCT